MNNNLHTAGDVIHEDSSFVNRLKKTVHWIGSRESGRQLRREEYHLSPKDGYLRSQTMLLNGKRLGISDKGNIPSLEPVFVQLDPPLYVSPMSIAFIVYPNFDAPACK
ncbi:hypothetical protein Dimus_028495 [Dionaea muscipula]